MREKRLILYGSVAGLLCGVALAIAGSSRPYTSTAVLRAVPSIIPERYSGAANAGVDRVMPNVVQTILSRGNLANVINLYGLYPDERSRMPMEDIIERMREAIRIGPFESDSMRVSFVYSDRNLAQSVMADLASRIITEYVRYRSMQTGQTVFFMRDRAATAAADWEKSLSAVRAAQAAGQPLDRVKLDVEIARRQYENLTARAAEAEILKSLQDRQQGPTLELFDPPSLPADDRPSIILYGAVGLVTGAFAGWLIFTVLSLRPRDRLLSRSQVPLILE